MKRENQPERKEGDEMYKTILVPLDGSKRAEAILPHVEDLSQRYGAKVFFLQVLSLNQFAFEPVMDYKNTYQEVFELPVKHAKSYLEGLKKAFNDKGIEVVTGVVRGSVVKEILHTAENEKADLIAIASHGRTGLPRVFYGSVTAGVLHATDRPILLIRSMDHE